MINKLIILVGLPGSGKTFYGNSILPDDGVFLDDLTNFEELVNAIQKYNTIIVSDPHLVNDGVRKNAENLLISNFPDSDIEWLFWSNDPTQAFKNVINRNDDRKISRIFIDKLSSNYNPPKIDFFVYNIENL